VSLARRRTRILLGATCALALLGACESFPLARDLNMCGSPDDTRPWSRLESQELDLAPLRALADGESSLPPARQTYRVESWFALPTGELKLCRSEKAPRSSCSGEWWEFARAGSDWQITRNSAWLCVD